MTTAAVMTPPPAGAPYRRRPAFAARFLVRPLSTLLLVAAVAAFLALAVGPRFLGYQTSTMLTGSMAPGIEPGDVIVDTQLPVGEVQVGDIITYHIPVDDHRVVSHRVVEVLHNPDGSTAIRTKGDANAGADPWTATLDGATAWQVRGVVPYAGTAIRTLRSPVVHDLLLYVGGAAALMTALAAIWRKPEHDEGDRSP